MDETQAAAQVIETTIQVGGELIPVGVKLTKGGAKAFFDFLQILSNTVRHALKGEKSTYARLIKEYGADLQVFRFPEEQSKQIHKLLKQYKIPYMDAQDLNLKDGYKEIFFPPAAAERMTALMERSKIGIVISREKYVEGADPDKLKKIKQEEANAVAGDREKKSGSVASLREAYRLDEYQENLHMEGRSRIEISVKDIVSETPDHYVARLPESKEYIKIDRNGEYPIYGQYADMLVFLSDEKSYAVMDAAGNTVREMSGEELKLQYYDPWTAKAYATDRAYAKREAYLAELDTLLGQEFDQKHKDVLQGLDRNAFEECLADPDKLAIEVRPEDIAERRPDYFVVRLPDTQDYMLVSRLGEYRMEASDDGLNIVLFLDKNAVYPVMDREGVINRKTKGSEIEETIYNEWTKQRYGETAAERFGRLSPNKEVSPFTAYPYQEKSQDAAVVLKPEKQDGTEIRKETGAEIKRNFEERTNRKKAYQSYGRKEEKPKTADVKSAEKQPEQKKAGKRAAENHNGMQRNYSASDIDALEAMLLGKQKTDQKIETGKAAAKKAADRKPALKK